MNSQLYYRLNKLEGEPLAPSQGYHGDAGWDLYTSRDQVIPPKTFADIHTDISIALPVGHWGFITGRSSTIRNLGVRVENGVIDAGYRGEMFVGAWNLNDHEVFIRAHSRIAQLIVIASPSFWWVEVDALPPTDRGSNGFGSTGH